MSDHGIPVNQSPKTLVELIAYRGSHQPTERWLTLLDSSGAEESLTYGELFSKSRRISYSLKHLGVGKNHPIPIILPTSIDFIVAFWGILLAGGIPVPLYPPIRKYQTDQYALQLRAVIKDCKAKLIVTSGILQGLVMWMARPRTSPLLLVSAQDLLSSGQEMEEIPVLKAEDTALIQYTSGSTGSPKGVELTHSNLLSNIRAIAKALDYRQDDVGVSWLPLYHDMGLIGSILSTLHFSIPIILISPLDFMVSPQRWLWAIHKYRGTLSAAPNFAYNLCARKIKDHELDGLDLSTWRVAINGAEPIHTQTLRDFQDRFGRYGFSKKTFLPAYGLAESTLAVTFAELDQEPTVRHYDRSTFEREGRGAPVTISESIGWVSLGKPLPGHHVRIVGREGHNLPERSVGDVIVQGPSVMKAYYQRPQETSDSLKGEWLHTGDLGFLDGGELCITGRSKDVIIKAGKNYYPHDMEGAAGTVDGVRTGCVVAFGVPDPKKGTEEIIVLAETRVRSQEKKRQIVHEIKKKIYHDTGCSPDRVLVLPIGSVAKTSSGKIQRLLCRERYLQGNIVPSKARLFWQWSRIFLYTMFRRRS